MIDIPRSAAVKRTAWRSRRCPPAPRRPAGRHRGPFEDLGGVDPIAGDGLAVNDDPQIRQACHLLRLDIGRALDLRDDPHDPIAEVLQRVQVLAKDGDRHIRADTGDEFLDAQLDRLRVAELCRAPLR
jgi:hypothetical protein